MSGACELEPGASAESVLVTTDSCDNFEQMSSSLEEIKNSNSGLVIRPEENIDGCNNVDNFEDACGNVNVADVQDDDYIRNKDWLAKRKHVFVLSSAGKPVYSRYGNEDKLATLFGVMQALVSFVQDQDDSIQSIHAGDTQFVFLFKSHLILVAISKTGESTAQLTTQLNYVFNQITSVLTLTRLNKIYEQRRNYDLRRLLSGVERLIDHLLDFSEREPAFTLGAVQCLSLTSSVRDTISTAIVQACNKIKMIPSYQYQKFQSNLFLAPLVAIVEEMHTFPEVIPSYQYQKFQSNLFLAPLVAIVEEMHTFPEVIPSYQYQKFQSNLFLAPLVAIVEEMHNFPEVIPSYQYQKFQSNLFLAPLVAIVEEMHNFPENLVFAILLANNKLITLVRMKKYCIHPADLHLIFNLIQASESLKTAESWTPLCLPRFDASGFLYGHVSYLAEDCQACLLLLTVEKEVFFTLSEAKQRIVEKLRRANCLEAINESLSAKDESCASAGFPDLRHYLYKCKSTAQFYQPCASPPYTVAQERLSSLYKSTHQILHCPSRPLKLIFQRTPEAAVLAWDTRGFELYAVLEPLTDTASAINTVSKLLNWIKKHENKLFHLNAPTF